MKFADNEVLFCAILLLCLKLKAVASLSGVEPLYFDVRDFIHHYGTPKLNNLAIHRDTGIVYIGAINHLYQLSPNLTLQTNISTGPILNSFSSQNQPNSSKIQIDNYNKILVIDFHHSRLIACGNIQESPCVIYSTENDISQSNGKEVVETENAIDADSSAVAIISDAKKYQRSSYSMLDVAQSSDYSAYVPINAHIDVKVLRKVPSNDKLYDWKTYRIYTPAPKNARNETYGVTYSCGFQLETCNYFLKIQESFMEQKSSYISKLTRICHEDNTNPEVGNTVTEFLIECISGQKHYGLVQAAHVGKPGLHLAKSLNISPNDDVLFAIFSESQDPQGYSNKPKNSSALCIYSPSLINKKIVSEHCDSQGPKTKKDEMDFNERCSERASPIMTFDILLTAINATKNGNYTDIFVGTNTGHIKKIIVKNATWAYEQADLKIDEGSPINSNLLFSPNKCHLYVMTEYRVTKINITQFNYSIMHSTYDHCVTHNLTFANPEIESIHPVEDPTHRGSVLTSMPSSNITKNHPNITITDIFVYFDNTSLLKSEAFKYIRDNESDDMGYNLVPKGIPSGGIEILIRNVSLNMTQELLFVVHHDGETFHSPCKMSRYSTTILSCPSPPISNVKNELLDPRNPRKMEFSLTNDLSSDPLINIIPGHMSEFLLYPDPEFYYFLNYVVKIDKNKYLIIQGKNINRACQKTDIVVMIGNDTCKVLSLSFERVACILPKSEQNDFSGETEEELEDLLVKHDIITIFIGMNFKTAVPKYKDSKLHAYNFKIHENNDSKIHEKDVTFNDTGGVMLVVAIAFTGILLLFIILLLIYHYHYRNDTSVKNSQALVEAQQRINKMCIESIALRQHIKQVIIENQIKLDEDSLNVLKLPNISIVDAEDARTIHETSSKTEYLVPFDGKWEFPRENLSLGHSLGVGEFGKVVQAKALGILQRTIVTTVAVKMLKDDHCDEDMIALVSEMEIMKLIGAHENVLQLLGCCSQNGELLVITEFASHGNLRDFLRNHLPSAKNKLALRNLSQKTLLMFAQQAAKGMEYLDHKKCVHRDLAARNVLVSNNYILKIADFGLARDIRNKEYYRKEKKGRLPVKWMAPEALGHGLYTTQSDVWSYGILLWEILTLGASPYPSFPNLEKLFKALRKGYRMEKPPTCSVEMYSLMCECWDYAPEDRPSFTMIIDILEQILKNSSDEELQRCDFYWPERQECSSSDEENSTGLVFT